jgi:hypothetical protein
MKKIVKIKESELVNLIDRIITESTSKSKNTDYDKEVDNYKYFIIDTKNKKVISGWEFKEDAKDSLDDMDNKENHKIVHLSKLSNYDIKDPKKTFKNNVNETKKIVKIKESELVNLIDRIITESTKKTEKKEDNEINYSYTSKEIYGMEYLFAYPDKGGIETKEGLEKWEMADRANRELMFVKTKKEATDTIKSFGKR